MSLLRKVWPQTLRGAQCAARRFGSWTRADGQTCRALVVHPRLPGEKEKLVPWDASEAVALARAAGWHTVKPHGAVSGTVPGRSDESEDSEEDEVEAEEEDDSDTSEDEEVEAYIARMERIDPKFYFYIKELSRVAVLVAKCQADILFVNAALSPVQQRHLEVAMELAWRAQRRRIGKDAKEGSDANQSSVAVFDRYRTVLAIFARRASSQHGRLSIELAEAHEVKAKLGAAAVQGITTQMQRIAYDLSKKIPGCKKTGLLSRSGAARGVTTSFTSSPQITRQKQQRAIAEREKRLREERFFIAVMFSILDAVRNRLMETSGNEVNQLSIQFIGYLVSLFFGLSISVFMEGQWGASRIFSCAALWRWSVVGLFFALKSTLLCVAYESGLHKMITILIGFLYVVIAAVVSFFVFSRLYGKLEWLSLSMIILSAPAFYIMRERCNTNYCHFFDFQQSDMSAFGAFCAFAGVSLSAIASILAERLFKNFSKGINRRDRRDDFNHGKYYIHRVHLDFSAALFLSAVWLWQHFLVHDDSLSNTRVLFGQWSAKHYVLVCVHAAQAWWAGLVVMHFSTVTKSLIQTVMGLLGLCIIDPLNGIDQGHNFGIRAVPSLLIAFIVVMSAILFQTGRLNMKFLRERAGVSPEQEVGGFRSLKRYLYSIVCGFQENGNQAIPRCNLLVYCLPVFYIISNALQTELTNTASANRFFVPQSLQVGIPLCGLSFAHVLTLQSYGLKGLAEAWNPRSLPKFFLLGLMQSVVSALAGMSMGLGMDSSLYVAMGKIYTPLSLVLGRWILKRRYLWIEWLSVMVLFVASVTLAFMDSSIAGNQAVRPSSAAAILCCAASASMACVYSVTMELALQKGDTPYVVNKIRLDFGAFLWSISFLPVMGYLGIKGHRPDLAYWYYRPSDYWTCIKLGSCDQESGLFVLHNSTADADALAKVGCYCDNGVFLGWGTWLPYAALASGVVYSWLTGKVIENFGTVMRSVLDGFPIVLLWFFISPMASRIPLAAFQAVYYKGPWPFINRAWGKDLMTIVNPLSAITYIEAAAQVRKVATLRQETEEAMHTNGSAVRQELSTDSDDTSSETGSSWTPDEDECNC